MCSVRCCIHKQLTGLRVSQCELQGFLSLKWHRERGMSGISIPGDDQKVSGHGSVLWLALYEQGGWTNLSQSVVTKAGWETWYILQEFKIISVLCRDKFRIFKFCS